ncbi:MAG TPA: hypothetical protein VLE45_12105 [Burkholderiaceae bacterium]|nr:hypothetical protein [Burkholderiaceae bacterium]
MQHRHWIWLAALAAGNAGAQSAARPDPADPAVMVPETAYRSAFEGYRNHDLSKQTPWRAANEEVGRIGGHAGILRERAAQDRAPATAPRATEAEGKGAPASPGDANAPGARR